MCAPNASFPPRTTTTAAATTTTAFSSNYYTPGRDGTRNAARRPGSGGRPRGCGFEEQGGGMYAYTDGDLFVYRGGYVPIAILSVCLCVCPSYSKLYFYIEVI